MIIIRNCPKSPSIVQVHHKINLWYCNCIRDQSYQWWKGAHVSLCFWYRRDSLKISNEPLHSKLIPITSILLYSWVFILSGFMRCSFEWFEYIQNLYKTNSTTFSTPLKKKYNCHTGKKSRVSHSFHIESPLQQYSHRLKYSNAVTD